MPGRAACLGPFPDAGVFTSSGPMPLPDLFSRIRKARLVQVLVVYVGASWVILQVADDLGDALALPDWVSPFVVLLLLVGLVIVMATAWVQTHPLIGSRAAADEVPEAWELDVSDLGRSMRKGKLPHLTWPRALLGGVVAFSLLIGVAGAYVLLRGPGPSPLAAEDGAAPGIAVLPFEARGVDETLWGDGLVDLVSTNLDGAGGLRAIDSRTVLAAWRQSRARAGGALTEALDVAGSAGARFAVVGNALGVGDRVRVTAHLHDVESGRELGAAQVEGAPDSVLALVDALSVDLLRELLSGRESAVTRQSLARVTTSSVPALRAFLRGEAADRRADFPAAIQAYEQALAEDSTFALAAYRLATAYGWIQSRGSEQSVRYRSLAAEHSDRLPSRDAALLEASEGALSDGDPASIRQLQDLATSYPDDPDIWNMLGEARWHLGPMALIPRSEAMEAFERAIALDSAFAPAYIHPIEMAIGAGRDSAAARELLDAYARVAAADVRLQALRLAYDLSFGDSPQWPDEATGGTLSYTGGILDRGGRRSLPARRRLFSVVEEAGAIPAGVPPDEVAGWRMYVNSASGRIDRAMELASAATPEARPPAVAVLVIDYGVAVPDSVVDPAVAVDSTYDAMDLLAATAVAARLGRTEAVERGLALLRARAGDGESGVMDEAAVRAAEAFVLWHTGEPEAAAVQLEEVRRETVGYEAEFLNELLRAWLGRIHLEAGRYEQAIRYLRSVPSIEIAGLHLAEAYEASGRAELARPAYADMVRIWEGADEGFEPLLRARRGLERLAPDR
jgi:TolB-like protein/predicted negative regulator of RcsB-dependent stress response